MAKPNPNEQIDWRKFPQFEQVFTEDAFEPFLKKVDKTCQALREAAAGGVKADTDRANAALAAYGHALGLVKEVLGSQATSPAPGR